MNLTLIGLDFGHALHVYKNLMMMMMIWPAINTWQNNFPDLHLLLASKDLYACSGQALYVPPPGTCRIFSGNSQETTASPKQKYNQATENNYNSNKALTITDNNSFNSCANKILSLIILGQF